MVDVGIFHSEIWQECALKPLNHCSNHLMHCDYYHHLQDDAPIQWHNWCMCVGGLLSHTDAWCEVKAANLTSTASGDILEILNIFCACRSPARSPASVMLLPCRARGSPGLNVKGMKRSIAMARIQVGCVHSHKAPTAISNCKGKLPKKFDSTNARSGIALCARLGTKIGPVPMDNHSNTHSQNYWV